MTNQAETQKQTIFDFFESNIQDYWKTVDEIVKGTGINHSTVVQILSTSGDFVRSSYRQKAGQPLYTTRNMFRDKAPFMDKMIGAFKNRID
jgi:hypothetical protein